METAEILVRSPLTPTTLSSPTRLRAAKSVPVLTSKSASSKPPTSVDPDVVRGGPLSGNSSISSAGLVRDALTRTFHGVGDLWLSWQDGLTVEERRLYRSREERKRILCERMKMAEFFKQWETAALELDTLDGNDQWKQDDGCADDCDYNPDLIRERLRDLDEARASGDIRAMMHLIRTAMSRDLGGMNNVDLYRHSYVGTKRLIERYVQSAIETIDAVVNYGGGGGGRAAPALSSSTSAPAMTTLSHKDLLDGMLLSRQSFGRSALLLSGGGTFGMSHVGVLKTLFQADLLPRIISGASAGSIVCSVMCTRTDEEMPELIRAFPYGDLAVFEAENGGDGMLGHLRRLLTEGSWSDINHLIRVMRGLTGDMTFQEAYNRTRRILNICVSTASVFEMPRLLNYVTAPNVMIWSAVAASCSVPLVFGASPLLVKDPASGEHRPWNPTPLHFIDGSVDNDLPMTRLSEMFNVNHFIVSQVNPHVVPFLDRDDHLSPDDRAHRAAAKARLHRSGDLDWPSTLTTLARGEALHRLQFLAEMGIMPNLVTKFRSILSQKYSGDITILPEVNMHDLPRLLKNPTTEFMLKSCLQGERATWPKLSRIRDRCAIELHLDRAVHRLRARVVFSESQRDLLRLNTSTGNLRLKQSSFMPGTQGSTAGGAGHGGGGGIQRRRRRRSGGSVQTLPDVDFFGSSDLTSDDETADEQPPYGTSRRHQGYGNTNAPRLHRASRSQIHISNHHQQQYSLSSAPPVPDLLQLRQWTSSGSQNFSRPLPQTATVPSAGLSAMTPTTPGGGATTIQTAVPVVNGEVLTMWPSAPAALTAEAETEAADMGDTSSAREVGLGGGESTGGAGGGALTSPTDDVETSEQGHWSDAVGEMVTEESDPDNESEGVKGVDGERL